jgi:hypothetical protein
MTNRPNVNMTAAEVQAVTPKPDSETQVGVITKAIMDAFTTLKPADDAATDAANEAAGVRERVMGEMAALSAAEDWSADHITDAAKGAVQAWKTLTGANIVSASLAQFAVELRRAMHPSARDYVADAIADSREQWEHSSQSEDHPLRKAFAKRYHMVAGSKGILQAHIDADMPAPKAGTPDKRIATDHGDASDPYAIAGAKQAAERVDPKAAARVIAKLVKALEALKAEFPVGELDQMLLIAIDLDADAFAKAKTKAAMAAAMAAKAQERTAKARSVLATPAAPAKGKAKATESALDEALDDMIPE